MQLRYSKTFKKQYQKLDAKWQSKCDERIRLWCIDPTHPQLRVHPLQGDRAGYWSLSISGDLRAIYRYEGSEVVLFVLLGTHSTLYKK